ncbi:hypothetical protein PSTT_04169 [Puccinia striiformis]|uniref:Pescadillo homolog n=1 Tax=Puccinia striiformis TaxID=27350 RepID=A0A2S4VTN9_9BASI|nr:hypothetical protein PSTT_04169 [Puccinia striiformis]
MDWGRTKLCDQKSGIEEATEAHTDDNAITLTGIYPREPRSRKKANRGSTAAASFYYQKDIAYLLHEPVLQKLRDHKAFAKKLSRALGRKEDGLAKNLDSAHEGYRIDHIIKERYPVFTDAIRDLDDALSLIILFANLPSTNHVSPKVIANCARLAAEWQIFVMKSKALKHVFLSIKGIYYQAEIEVYPPKLDFNMDEAGAGLNALILESSNQALVADQIETNEPTTGRQTAKNKKKATKMNKWKLTPVVESNEEDEPGLFSPYAFFLSREVTRPMLEFVIKCSGGEVGWDPILGAGSPYLESDPRITHHVIDRPELPASTTSLPQRAFIQPQWVSTLLPAEEYAPGKILPPHLSPFINEEEVRRQGGYLPQASQTSANQGAPTQTTEMDEDDEEEEEEEEEESTTVVEKAEKPKPISRPALLAAAASNGEDSDLLKSRPKNLEINDQFQKELKKATKNNRKSNNDKNHKNINTVDSKDPEDNSKMAEMLLSSKQRKLYTKMSYTKHQRAEEKRKLETKKKILNKKQKKLMSKMIIGVMLKQLWMNLISLHSLG